jgi:hypothetical protein
MARMTSPSHAHDEAVIGGECRALALYDAESTYAFTCIGSSGEQRDCTGSVGAHAVCAAEEEAAELEPAPSERYSRY